MLFNIQSVTFSRATLPKSIVNTVELAHSGQHGLHSCPNACSTSSGFDDGLESAVEHALHIERHGL